MKMKKNNNSTAASHHVKSQRSPWESIPAVYAPKDENGYHLTPIEAAERQERLERRNEIRKELGLDAVLDELQKQNQIIKNITDTLQLHFQRI